MYPSLPDLPGVEFRLVTEYPGFAVGDDGSVWSCRAGRKPGLLLDHWVRRSTNVCKNGNPQLTVSQGERRVNVGVQRLVLLAFVGPPPIRMEAFWENGDKADCRLANLSWKEIDGRRTKIKPGEEFERLRVVRRVGLDRHGYSLMLCECKCGNTTTVSAGNLLNRRTKSCGCLLSEGGWKRFPITDAPWKIKHGYYGTPTYRSWQAMLSRCRNSNNPNWPRYGGCGVTVHPLWLDFAPFLADVGERPSLEHSLDRWPNPNGDYVPGNVKWSTAQEQARHRRNAIWIEYDGEELPAIEWAERVGIAYDRLIGRLKQGWTVERALMVPVGKYTPRGSKPPEDESKPKRTRRLFITSDDNGLPGCPERRRVSSHLPRFQYKKLRAKVRSAIDRCHNPSSRQYGNYGGRGIKVQENWRLNRDRFVAYLISLPGHDNPELVLDRIDTNGNYEEGNLRFVNLSDSNYNRRCKGKPYDRGRSTGQNDCPGNTQTGKA